MMSYFKVIWAVQFLAQKYSAFHSTQISGNFRASRLDKRGGSRVVTNARRDAVDAGSVRREACLQGGYP
ncbi:hypothetical protein KIP88_23640 [Bradyrhizobium sp. SRL28]|uniref:hypothetical protein n=1 Tax=Bradyrhizobium sp. SRL28 TaxID=2836178 RepID=UPI001BDE414C|nr:hypothetical protein [Bradyrhizobium sp. SRL28]MBT1513493.1 hypothetical protein [Bradyrhizobium sp. SRL28]